VPANYNEMSLQPGTRIGPYEITALIGEGGMGKVWRAHHTGLKRDDALKALPDAFAPRPTRSIPVKSAGDRVAESFRRRVSRLGEVTQQVR
jgi:serine/threonine protein kinase